MVKLRIYYCFCCCFLSCVLFAQKDSLNVRIQYFAEDVSKQFITDTLVLQTQFKTIGLCKQYIQQLPNILQKKGYISASVDSVFFNANNATAFLFIGKKYTWKQIEIPLNDAALPLKLNTDISAFSGNVISPQNFLLLQNKLLQWVENSGYPFAVLGLDSIAEFNQGVYAKMYFDKGIKYKLDSIHQIGKTVVSANFLHKYLGLKKGSLFNVKQLQQINQQLAALPYLQQTKPWDVQMLASSYVVNMYLQNQKSNQVNVLLGFLPANQQLGGKLLLTGEANILLNNSFAKAETIAVNWQQLQTASPRLQLLFKQPFFLNSPFGLQFNFELYKRDSAFLNIQTQLGIQYAVGLTQKLNVAIQQFSTNILTVDTVAIINSKKLPDVADMQVTNISVAYQFNNTNYKPNPLKGRDVVLAFAIGNKNIRKNNSIVGIKNVGFNYESLYDTISLNSYQLKLNLQYAEYLKFGKQSVVKTAVQVGWLQSDSYFRNELFQIGGNKLLRGFDEESILANKYAVFTAEYRYLLGKNAFFATFADVGFTHNSITKLSNQFLGAGFGLALETKQGIFNITYAAGKRNDLPFSLRQSKIHIGFVSLF